MFLLFYRVFYTYLEMFYLIIFTILICFVLLLFDGFYSFYWGDVLFCEDRSSTYLITDVSSNGDEIKLTKDSNYPSLRQEITLVRDGPDLGVDSLWKIKESSLAGPLNLSVVDGNSPCFNLSSININIDETIRIFGGSPNNPSTSTLLGEISNTGNDVSDDHYTRVRGFNFYRTTLYQRAINTQSYDIDHDKLCEELV